jgi:protein-S-isoprenylcysteine O-methyltransferase Ste14
MKPWVRALGLVAILWAMIGVFILLPAALLGVTTTWQVLVLALAYFLFFLIGTVDRVLRHGDLANRRQDRQVRARSGRLAFIGGTAGLLAAHWVSLYTFAQRTSIEPIWAVVALPLIVASLFLSQVAIRTLGRFFDRLTIKQDHQLVTSGVYGVIRHPIYTSYILLFSSFPILLGSLWGMAILILACVIWFGSRITLEERMLEEQFGESYRSYRLRTKRLIPFVY